MLLIPNRQNPQLQRYHTEFLVQKTPIREKQQKERKRKENTCG